MEARYWAGHVVNTEVYSWDTSFSHVYPRRKNPRNLVVFCVYLVPFLQVLLCSWDGRTHGRPRDINPSFEEPDRESVLTSTPPAINPFL
jgi:hypothetical protein